MFLRGNLAVARDSMTWRHPRAAYVLGMLAVASALAGCSDQKPQQAAAAALPVTVAQPVKRTVTDWDEFTGRFEPIEEVQVRARVGGYVTSVEFQDGVFVFLGVLLFVFVFWLFVVVVFLVVGLF